jgi:hypothetical protein
MGAFEERDAYRRLRAQVLSFDTDAADPQTWLRLLRELVAEET